MQIKAIRTKKITVHDKDINKILDLYITDLKENSILCITSKIISITEGRTIKSDEIDKDDLVKKESELYIDKKENKYGMYLTISDGLLAPTAGIDESNGNGYLVLWPRDSYKSAHEIRNYLKNKFGLKNLGVIITDSKTTPLRWGTTGVSLGHAGFNPLRDYIGKNDLFDHTMRVTKASVVDGLAASVVFAMGEGDESTPLALITDLENIEFLETDPTSEKAKLYIEPDTDLYASILKSAPWKKGEEKTS